MAKVIDGHMLAEKIKDRLVKEIIKLGDARPNLAIILIGERKDSCLYVELKEKEAKRVGIDTHIYKCQNNIPQYEIFDMIKHLNEDKLIDAILVQLPLPAGFDTDGIIRAIDPAKDVDCFHPDNLGILFKTCNHFHVMPPVYRAVLEMFNSIECDLMDKEVCILANSEIFGSSLKKVLECLGARCIITSADESEIENKTKKADILISAIGRKRFIKGRMVKKDAIIIDIGITKEGKKVYGDIDFEDVRKKASFITPVPGGVGPLTIAMLFKNTLELYKKRHIK